MTVVPEEPHPIDTDYAVRLFFANTSFLQVYFEAVANAFDAGADQVAIHVKFNGELQKPRVVLTITDNGEGFTDENFRRFAELVPPKDELHKGLGRLVFLQYFREVKVSSRYNASRRTFSFSRAFRGESTLTGVEDQPARETTLIFTDFLGSRIKSYSDLRPASLKARLIEQFFPLWHQRKLANAAFHVSIELDTDEDNEKHEFFSGTASIHLDDIPELAQHTFKEPLLDHFADITMWYSVSTDVDRRVHFTAASVDGRTIPLDLFAAKALPLDCAAVFFFESELFTGKSDSARQRLVLPEGKSEKELFRRLRAEVSRVLNAAVPEIAAKNAATKADYNDIYPHLAGLFDEDSVGLIDRDEAIEQAQGRFFRKQRQVLDGDALADDTFDQTLELSARSLMEYVLYRDFVVRKLAGTTPDVLEEVIHNLVVPQREQFDQETFGESIYRNNAWLLDDRFMTFRTILSEARMDEVIRAITMDDDVDKDEGRPDISMIFSADPDDDRPVDVVVVELKRRKPDPKEGLYAATQLILRAQKLVDTCPNIQRVWYYGIIEIDDAMDVLLRNLKWKPLYSLGKVYYQELEVRHESGEVVPTPTYLVSFDAVVDDAAARNHAFLEVLRAGLRQQAPDAQTPEQPAGAVGGPDITTR